MPGFAKAAARAVVSNLQRAQTIGLQLADFGVQSLATFGNIRLLLRIAKVHLVDDGQHRDFKQNRVQPWAFDGNFNLTRGQRGNFDVLFVQLENAQKVDEVAFDKPHGFKVGQLCILKPQAAQSANLLANFIDIRCQYALVSAFKSVFDFSPGKLVQHHLHHGELVQIGV